jgi:hypothetical protein
MECFASTHIYFLRQQDKTKKGLRFEHNPSKNFNRFRLGILCGASIDAQNGVKWAETYQRSQQEYNANNHQYQAKSACDGAIVVQKSKY